MNRLTKNFNFITNSGLRDQLLRLEHMTYESDFSAIPAEARNIVEHILESEYNIQEDNFTNKIKRYKELYGDPLITDALFHIKNVGNTNYSSKRNTEVDYTSILYTLKSVGIILHDAFKINEMYKFNDKLYIKNSSIKNQEIINTEYSIKNEQLQISKSSIFQWLKLKQIIFFIPYYQRKYTWDNHNLETLFNDINDRFADGFQHYFGVIALKRIPNKENNIEFRIIDGQQRITTSILLLKAAYDSSNVTHNKKIKILDDIFSSFLDERYINNSLKKGEEEELKMIFNGSLNINANDHWSYGRNYKFFRMKFDTMSYDELFNIVITFIQKFEIAYIEYDVKKEREMDIFENMNSKGSDLDEWDLIRNQIFNMCKNTGMTDLEKLNILETKFRYLVVDGMKSPNEELAKFSTEYCYFKLSYSENTFREYKRFPTYNNFKHINVDTNFSSKSEYEKFINNMLAYGIIFKAWAKKDISIISSDLESCRLAFQNICQKQQILFLIMVIIDKTCNWDGEKWVLHNLQSLKKSIKMLNSILMRLEIVRGFGHSPRHSYFSIAKEIVNSNDIYESLNYQLLNNESFKNYIVTDAEVKERLMSGMKDNLKRKILNQLNNYMILNNDDETTLFINKPSLEHVMPQSPVNWKNYLIKQSSEREWEEIHKMNLNKIGNALILPKRLNSQASNKNYYDKKKLLLKFKIPLIYGWESRGLHGIMDIEEWSIQLIKDRTKIITNILLTTIYNS